MFILSPDQIESKLTLPTPSGDQQVLVYRNRFYILQQTFKNLQDAIKSCRNCLDNGIFGIIVQEPQCARLWILDAKHSPDDGSALTLETSSAH